jgi:hypothetical protein
MQELAAAAEYVPVRQRVQDADPGVEYVPAVQAKGMIWVFVSPLKA